MHFGNIMDPFFLKKILKYKLGANAAAGYYYISLHIHIVVCVCIYIDIYYVTINTQGLSVTFLVCAITSLVIPYHVHISTPLQTNQLTKEEQNRHVGIPGFCNPILLPTTPFIKSQLFCHI